MEKGKEKKYLEEGRRREEEPSFLRDRRFGEKHYVKRLRISGNLCTKEIQGPREIGLKRNNSIRQMSARYREASQNERLQPCMPAQKWP